jgi:hypothetical protein
MKVLERYQGGPVPKEEMTLEKGSHKGTAKLLHKTALAHLLAGKNETALANAKKYFVTVFKTNVLRRLEPKPDMVGYLRKKIYPDDPHTILGRICDACYQAYVLKDDPDEEASAHILIEKRYTDALCISQEDFIEMIRDLSSLFDGFVNLTANKDKLAVLLTFKLIL